MSKDTYTRQMLQIWVDASYAKADKTMCFRADKQKIACCYGFEYISEMMIEYFNAGFTPAALGRMLEMTGAGVRYQLKRMGCEMRKPGGFNGIESRTGIPGVYPLKKNGRFQAQLYKKGKKYRFGQHDTLFAAAVARRWGEIKHGYDRESLAQRYINGVLSKSCDRLDCMECQEYELESWPRICKGDTDPAAHSATDETMEEFLQRAENIVQWRHCKNVVIKMPPVEYI